MRAPRLTHLIAFIFGSCLLTSPALAVAPHRLASLTPKLSEVLPHASLKAQAETQIRRLKNLLATRQAKDSHKAFEVLEKLQKSLHGQNE